MKNIVVGIMVVFSPLMAQDFSSSQILKDSTLRHTVRNHGNMDTLKISSIPEMLTIYKGRNFSLDSIRKHKCVPSVHAVNFPADLRTTSFVNKKNIFIGVVLSAILQANKEVLLERDNILEYAKKVNLTTFDSVQLAEYKRKYYASSIEELLQKVDVLPPSLVIAQGINESGWGTSFFAREANSIFGLKAPSKSSLQTLKHPKTTFRTYKFETLEEGVREYLLNMNRHRLYLPLRNLRALSRKKGLIITGKALLPGMKRYSSRGTAYLRTVSKLITMYNLEDFDNCFLYEDKGIVLRF